MKKRTKSIIRGAGVLGVALAAGHLVQTMNADKAKPVAQSEAAVNIEKVAAEITPEIGPAQASPNPLLPAGASLAGAVVETPSAETAEAALPEEVGTDVTLAGLPSEGELPDTAIAEELFLPETPTDTGAAEAQPELAALTDEVALPEPLEGQTTLSEETATDCAPSLTLALAPQAMISVNLVAPCDAGARVVLRHAGLAFAEELGPDGRLSLDLPALEAKGSVSVLFPDAEIATASVAVGSLDAIRRFAVQWMADDTFQLHALENGAGYDDPGHVSADNPVSPSGGYIVSLGNPSVDLPMMAAVYTWPGTATAHPVVEAEVTELTCGRELLGETLFADKGTLTVTDLTLAMPDCDATGDILVLNNLVPDMTLAAAN